MTRDEVRDKVFELLATELNKQPSDLNEDMELMQMELDSFAVVELVFKLEEAFDIELEVNANDIGETIKTIGDVVDGVLASAESSLT